LKIATNLPLIRSTDRGGGASDVVEDKRLAFAGADGLPAQQPVEAEASVAAALRRPEPIDALTGLRFVAAFTVLVAHATNWLVAFDPPVHFMVYLSFGSALGMPLFFVLSGFVIHYNYGRSFLNGLVEPTIDFFIARFARLYPLYILALGLYLTTHGGILAIFSGGDVSYLPRFLLLWQAWGLEYRGTTWFGHLSLPLAWSISVEVFFYALYPCLALPLMRLRRAGAAGVAFAIIAVGFYAAIVVCYRNFDALRIWGNGTFFIDADPQNALLGWVFNTGPVGRFWEFLMGAIVAQAFLSLQERPPGPIEERFGAGLVVATTLAIATIYILAPHNAFIAFFGSYPGGFAPLFAVLIFGCARYRSPIGTMLARRPLVALGEASYSIYLLHEFTLSLLRQPVTWPVSRSGLLTWAVTMGVGIGMTLLVSLGTYRVLEVPARNFVRRTLHRAKKWLPLEALPRQVPSWIAPSVAAAVIVGGVVVWNWPRTLAIDIIEANYGANCASSVLPPPYTNGFHQGNATLFVRQYMSRACGRRLSCDYTINVNYIGDPVHGCAKDFAASYRCPGDPQVLTVWAPAEANLRTVRFNCN
jgi:peptidoglycan/LPS O-acetylase OafA/YrhL